MNKKALVGESRLFTTLYPPTCLPNSLPTYLPPYLLTYLPPYLPTYLPIHIGSKCDALCGNTRRSEDDHLGHHSYGRAQ